MPSGEAGSISRSPASAGLQQILGVLSVRPGTALPGARHGAFTKQPLRAAGQGEQERKEPRPASSLPPARLPLPARPLLEQEEHAALHFLTSLTLQFRCHPARSV